MRKELSKVYEPQEVEGRIYEQWEENSALPASAMRRRSPYTIVMPPPNVTGQLHMGHAMDCTLQDILIRFKRMQGYAALWVPGTDHAGIATQIKVEEELRVKEGLTRYDLGREKFLERVWAWKHQYGDRIVAQQKKLGASCDWDRARFTMDEGCSKAVRETFCEPLREGPYLQGQPDHQLVPPLRHRPVRRRGGVRGQARPPVAHALSPGRRVRLSGGGHHPAGDHDGRHRRGRQPQRRAVPAPGGQDLHPAPDEPGDPHRGRRLCGDGLRHRLREDDPRPRPQRLRGGPAPQPGDHPGAGRQRRSQRQRRQVRGHGPLRGPEGRGGRPGGRWACWRRSRTTPTMWAPATAATTMWSPSSPPSGS